MRNRSVRSTKSSDSRLGRFASPGAMGGGGTAPVVTPSYYVTENAANFYVTENDENYVTENSPI